MRSVDITERRHRLGTRHFLAAPGSSPVDAAIAMTALHSSDPGSVYLSVWARTEEFAVSDLESALYEDRTLVRMHGMRRTLWVVPREHVALIDNSSTRAIAERERRRTIKFLEDGGVTDDAETWLESVVPQVLDHVKSRGEVLTRELSSSIPALNGKIEFYNNAGQHTGTTGVASRVILQMSMEARLVRTRPAGTWISGQYHWAATEVWLGGQIPDMSAAEASTRLVENLLRTFGPVTEVDLRWWTGWRVSQVRRALADVDAVEVGLDGSAGFLLAEDIEPVASPDPWAALLPSLDPTTMGWKEREWYLGDHGDRLFDRNGNAGPTVWVDGRIVGGWAQLKDGELVYEVFDDVGREAEGAIEARADELTRWLDGSSVPRRFRSPHDHELAP